MQIVDCAIVCALDVEFEAVLRRFGAIRSGEERVRGECAFVRLEATSNAAALRVVIVCIGRMGNLGAQDVVSQIIRELSPRFVILVGICGGILRARDDYRLGDVVFAREVIHYEPAKISGGEYMHRSERFECDELGMIDFHTAAVKLEEGPWTAEAYIGVPRPRDAHARERPHLKCGAVLSGEKVIADPLRAEELLKLYPDAVSIEMEAAGLAYACQSHGTGFLVIKAVSDPADSTKNDEFRAYASATAASFVHCLLTETRLSPRSLPVDTKVPLGDLFRLSPGDPVRIILPSYVNARHQKQRFDNYPYNLYESAFDDVYTALRIISALEATCGQENIRYYFDRDSHIPPCPNTIVLGSSVANVYTEDCLRDAYFRFSREGPDDHDLVGRDPKHRYSAQLDISRERKTFTTDYSLISVSVDKSGTTVVLSGCRAYGQLVIT